jgi:hypothetical protein
MDRRAANRARRNAFIVEYFARGRWRRIRKGVRTNLQTGEVRFPKTTARHWRFTRREVVSYSSYAQEEM